MRSNTPHFLFWLYLRFFLFLTLSTGGLHAAHTEYLDEYFKYLSNMVCLYIEDRASIDNKYRASKREILDKYLQANNLIVVREGEYGDETTEVTTKGAAALLRRYQFLQTEKS